RPARAPRAAGRAWVARKPRSSSGGAAGAPDPRVELRVQKVGDEVGHDDRDRSQQHHSLDHRVVTLGDRGEESETDALVREDLLDDRGAPDDEADADRELCDEWQDGVPSDVGGAYPAVGEPARSGRGDVVLL